MISKFLLVINGESGEGACVTVCDTREERDALTIEAIYGPDKDSDRPGAEKYMEELRDSGHVEFESDPGLSWIDAYHVGPCDHERKTFVRRTTFKLIHTCDACGKNIEIED